MWMSWGWDIELSWAKIINKMISVAKLSNQPGTIVELKHSQVWCVANTTKKSIITILHITWSRWVIGTTNRFRMTEDARETFALAIIIPKRSIETSSVCVCLLVMYDARGHCTVGNGHTNAGMKINSSCYCSFSSFNTIALTIQGSPTLKSSREQKKPS